MSNRPLQASFLVLALVCSAVVLPATSSEAQEAQKQDDLKKQPSVPPVDRSESDLAGKQEPSAKIANSNAHPEPLWNGALTVAGAPEDSDTIPSLHSQRTAADDKLPTAAYTFKHLTDDQRKAIRKAAAGDVSDSGSRAIGGFAKIGAEVPPSVAWESLQPLPTPVLAQLPETKGIAFILSEDKVLLVNAKNRMVVAVLD
jgi:hypothetical protein